jgi:hypothetical protein
VTGRFRRRLCDRVRDGAADLEVAREEATTRYQVAHAFALASAGRRAGDGAGVPRRLSLDETHHRPGRELATVAPT